MNAHRSGLADAIEEIRIVDTPANRLFAFGGDAYWPTAS